jgi:hypothetical protein
MKHPRQREMWEGLTGTGCLNVVLIMILVMGAIEVFLN